MNFSYFCSNPFGLIKRKEKFMDKDSDEMLHVLLSSDSNDCVLFEWLVRKSHPHQQTILKAFLSLQFLSSIQHYSLTDSRPFRFQISVIIFWNSIGTCEINIKHNIPSLQWTVDCLDEKYESKKCTEQETQLTVRTFDAH